MDKATKIARKTKPSKLKKATQKAPPPHTAAPSPPTSSTLNKFWEAGPTLHDFFDGEPEDVREKLAMHDYEHGSTDLLSKLVLSRTGRVLSKKLATYLASIVRGEVRRGKGRPKGSAQDDPVTRFRIYAQIVRWKESGQSFNRSYAKIATLAGRDPRVIRQYHEEFKKPPPVKPVRSPKK